MSLEPSERSAEIPPSKPKTRWAALAGNVLILSFSLLLSLFVAEVGYRVAMGVPVLDLTDWRSEGARTDRIGDRAALDPLLGWTLRPNYRSPDFNTIEHGFRRNFDETEVRTGAILAVGDSFTEGFEDVNDSGTWPAHLEKMMNIPVVNGGVSGYATDQIILRAERLLPVVAPKTLIIGFTEADIYRTGLSDAGAPKPYFTLEKGEPVYHPPGPVEGRAPESLLGKATRSVLGYSALADHLFSRLTPTFWYPAVAWLYEEVENQPLDITCKLLARLKQQTDERQVRLLVFLQYAGELVLEEPAIIDDMRVLSECTKKAGIQVVDHFAPLKAVTLGNPDLVAQYYALEGEEFGHMTAKGNEHAAQLLASALRSEAPPAASIDPRDQEAHRNSSACPPDALEGSEGCTAVFVSASGSPLPVDALEPDHFGVFVIPAKSEDPVNIEYRGVLVSRLRGNYVGLGGRCFHSNRPRVS